MIAVVQNPQIAHYTPRTSLGDLQEAFRTRWVHGLNTKSPWNFVRDIISKDYHRFQPIPWFIGEYGASGQDEDTIRADLECRRWTAPWDQPSTRARQPVRNIAGVKCPVAAAE